MGILLAYLLGILSAINPKDRSRTDQNSQISILPDSPLQVTCVPRALSEEEKAKTRKKQKRETISFWVGNISLAVLVVYAGFTILIWRANKRSADAATRSTDNADKSFRQDERAWMAFKFKEGNITLTIGKSFLIPTELTNVGKTPAKNVRGSIVVDVYKKGQPLDFTYTSGHAVYRIEAGTMFPTGTITESFEAIKHGKEHAEPIIFTPTLKDDLFNAKSFLIVHGIIYYNDIFGTEHWTKYCRYVLHPELISDECTRHNDTDDNR